MSEAKEMHELNEKELSDVSGGGIVIRISRPTSGTSTTISISKSGPAAQITNSIRKKKESV